MIFGKGRRLYNQAVSKFMNLHLHKTVNPAGYKQMLLEIIELLQETLKKDKRNGDAYVMLANAYYLITLPPFDGRNYSIYMPLAAAVVSHWKNSRFYTKDKQNGAIMYSKIVDAIVEPIVYWKEGTPIETTNLSVLEQKYLFTALEEKVVLPDYSVDKYSNQLGKIYQTVGSKRDRDMGKLSDTQAQEALDNYTEMLAYYLASLCLANEAFEIDESKSGEKEHYYDCVNKLIDLGREKVAVFEDLLPHSIHMTSFFQDMFHGQEKWVNFIIQYEKATSSDEISAGQLLDRLAEFTKRQNEIEEKRNDARERGTTLLIEFLKSNNVTDPSDSIIADMMVNALWEVGFSRSEATKIVAKAA